MSNLLSSNRRASAMVQVSAKKRPKPKQGLNANGGGVGAIAEETDNHNQEVNTSDRVWLEEAGQAPEQATDVTCRARLLTMLNNLVITSLIIILLLADASILGLSFAVDFPEFVDYIRDGLLAVFVVEFILRVFCSGCSYFRAPLLGKERWICMCAWEYVCAHVRSSGAQQATTYNGNNHSSLPETMCLLFLCLLIFHFV